MKDSLSASNHWQVLPVDMPGMPGELGSDWQHMKDNLVRDTTSVWVKLIVQPMLRQKYCALSIDTLEEEVEELLWFLSMRINMSSGLSLFDNDK